MAAAAAASEPVSSGRVDALLDALEDLGYPDLEEQAETLAAALIDTRLTRETKHVAAWIASGISKLCQLDSAFVVTEEDDDDSFTIDLSTFLKEYGCALPLLEGGALASPAGRFRLLEYLASEFQACRMCAVKRPDAIGKMAIDTSPTASAKTVLSDMLKNLAVANPASSSLADVFAAASAKINETVARMGKDYIAPPLFTTALSAEQWAQLEAINTQLVQEYNVRRKMLLKRLDVTIQSFLWSDRAKAMTDEIERIYQPQRAAIKVNSTIEAKDILFASRDLTRIEKTSNSGVRQSTHIAKLVIGAVPDRGGRPSEKRAPPNMPRFRKRTEGTPMPPRSDGGGAAAGGGRGRGKKGGGKRVQGGWQGGKGKKGGGGGGGGGGGRGARTVTMTQG